MSVNRVMSKISMQSARNFPKDFFAPTKFGKKHVSDQNVPANQPDKIIIFTKKKNNSSRNNSLKPVRK